MKILVTGASGFIGSYIVEEALRQGMETWAAVRPTSSRKYLQDERIHFINLNLSSEEELEKELAPHEFDYIVHAAGATKCLHAEDFYRVNTEGTKHLVKLQMEMAAALLLVLDVLIAGTGLAVKGVFADKSLLHQTVELSVYCGDSHGSSLSRQKGAYLLDIGVLVLVFHKI